jgi:hypothetical protein
LVILDTFMHYITHCDSVMFASCTHKLPPVSLPFFVHSNGFHIYQSMM